MRYKVGYLPDEKDNRDWKFKHFAQSKNLQKLSSASLRDNVVEVLNQLNIGSCVANSGFQGIRMSQIRQLKDLGKYNSNNPPPLGSRLFGYYNPRSYHNATSIDSGTYIRYFFKALNKFGFCPEYIMPYNTVDFDKRPSHAVYKAAYDQKDPTDYYRIEETGEERLEQIELAISNGYPVVFGTEVSKDFCMGININDVIDPPINLTIAGGHAMLIEGFEDKKYTILNSWSDEFGNDGRIVFSADYIMWAKTQDLWVVKAAPQYSN